MFQWDELEGLFKIVAIGWIFKNNRIEEDYFFPYWLIFMIEDMMDVLLSTSFTFFWVFL